MRKWTRDQSTEEPKRTTPRRLFAPTPDTIRSSREKVEAIVGDPRTFEHARKTFAKDAAKFREQIRELSMKAPYPGQGRRPRVDPERVRSLVKDLTAWLERRPKLLKAQQVGAQAITASELVREIDKICQGFVPAIVLPSSDQVQEVLFGRRSKPRTKAIELAALVLGVSDVWIRKLIQTPR